MRMRVQSVAYVACGLALTLIAENAWAVGKDKVKFIGGTVASVKEKTEGRIDLKNPENMVFTADKAKEGLIAIPWKSVSAVEYGQNVSRRWKTAIFLTPWALFSKGRKHIVTITYKDPEGVDQAAVFEFGKEVYRTTLAALKVKSGVEIDCQDEEAKKHYGGACRVMAPEPEEEKK
jgi:hypothetical protein